MRSNRGKGKGITFLKAALAAETDDCIIWPFYTMKNGYAQAGFHFGMALAHRWVCEQAHGAPPDKGYDAAHGCGHRSCVNPRHLRWATKAENEADKKNHGTYYTRLGGAKLDPERVRAIRTQAACGLSLDNLSSRFSTPVSTIRKVVNRETWKHV